MPRGSLGKTGAGHGRPMAAIELDGVQLENAWIDDDETARWRSASGHTPEHGAAASGSSLLEVEPGCRLPRHRDSAEEVVVVLEGSADMTIGAERHELPTRGIALVPANVPHEVRNAGTSPLRFLAVYAATDVVTTYESPVQPGGKQERRPLG